MNLLRMIRNHPLGSIRAKLIVSFIGFFLLCTMISVGSIWMLYVLEKKIDFLEIANNYMVEIQQVRRYEKNYLLYGTNLGDAVEHLNLARNILTQNQKTIEKILGRNHSATMVQYMTEYNDQIANLGLGKRSQADMALLRNAGSQMVTFAEEFVTKEREAMGRMFRMARHAPVYFIGVLLVMMIFIFITLTRQLVMSLNRFMTYTKRIGEGDFTPILQKKHYSDEFSQLADAFNQMVKELDHRHEILVQSHKLRAIGTLVAGVAHELNNPLNNSMLTASMLKEDFGLLSEEDKMDMIDDMIHETERSQRIVRELLDFARESETHIKPLKVEAIMKDSIRLVANQIKMAKVRMDVDFSEELPPIHGDEQMLKQVFVNLILNAVDALPAKGCIRISIHKKETPGYVTVDINDDGPGIPEHVQARIFEPFFTTKAKGKGVGLGLSVSRGIIRKLGGYITLASEPGKGTTFTVAIPTTDFPSKIMSET
ncbi:MAG: HAMP domain-containing histidine kinase [Proteobacteria bacterium]|nr:HAMP domain-containing histidine kinase [Pseudomonadota bacterium]